jgi:hypothetical protein
MGWIGHLARKQWLVGEGEEKRSWDGGAFAILKHAVDVRMVSVPVSMSLLYPPMSSESLILEIQGFIPSQKEGL